MHDINTISFDLIGRDFSKMTDGHRAALATPADNLPLAASIEVLTEIVRCGGSYPFAFRIPDDARLLAVWTQANTTAVVATYWRRKLAHVDLLIASDVDQSRPLLEIMEFTNSQLQSIRQRPCPLLVRCRVRQHVPSIAEVLGLIAYTPAMLELAAQ